MTDRVDQRLGNYRLTRLLGAGGFGEVYLGEDVRHNNAKVAVKVLPPLAQDDLQSFLTEVGTVRLKHPNIVKIFDFGIWERSPYIVMEYAPNGTLRQRHPKGTQVPLPTIVSYVKQIASALQFAHNEGVVHRDVRPENMLIGKKNKVLLSDFGIAIIFSSAFSKTGDAKVSVAYMAPEQISEKARPASDQYALGVVVYEWLCGERPFHGTLPEIAAKHVIVPPPSLHEKGLAVPSEVEQVVLKALAKDPKGRFNNVKAFSISLERAAWQGESRRALLAGLVSMIVSGGATALALSPKKLTPSQPSPALPQPFSPPSQGLPLGTALYIYRGHSGRGHAAGVLSVAWSPIRQRVASGSSDRTVQIWDAADGSHVFTYRGHSAELETVAWSPDGKRIASGSLDMTLQVWNATDGGNVFTYRGHSDVVNAVVWSPDGTRIASGSWDKTVQVWDATTGGHKYTYRGHFDRVIAVAWSPDGKRIASGGPDKTVQVWDATTGDRVFTYRGHSSAVYAIAWSPNSKRIASGSDDGTVQVWDATTGDHMYSYRGHNSTVWGVVWSPDGKRIASGGDDKTVQIWDATTGGQVFTCRGHSWDVLTVAWSSDGQRIASGSADWTARVWQAE